MIRPTPGYPDEVTDLALLAAVAASSPEVILVVVFGSVGRGAAREESDVDLGVLLEPDTAEVRVRVEATLTAASRREVDFVVINDAPPQVRFEIAGGVKLFERRPGVWRDTKARAMLDWWEWQPTARWVHEQYLARLRRQVGAGRGA